MGVGQGRADLGMTVRELGPENGATMVEEGLKIELGKQGVFVTSLQELYNWGRRSSMHEPAQSSITASGWPQRRSSIPTTLPVDCRRRGSSQRRVTSRGPA